MLTLTTTLERLEAVAWRRSEITERSGRMQQQQLATRLTLYGPKPRNILVRKETRRGGVLEGPDHLSSLFRIMEYNK